MDMRPFLVCKQSRSYPETIHYNPKVTYRRVVGWKPRHDVYVDGNADALPSTYTVPQGDAPWRTRPAPPGGGNAVPCAVLSMCDGCAATARARGTVAGPLAEWVATLLAKVLRMPRDLFAACGMQCAYPSYTTFVRLGNRTLIAFTRWHSGAGRRLEGAVTGETNAKPTPHVEAFTRALVCRESARAPRSGRG
jgi:hypothetical protein